MQGKPTRGGRREAHPQAWEARHPPGREGMYSHGHRPQQLQDALPVPLLGCMELLSADANNLRPRDKMPLCVNGHSSHSFRRSATQALSVPPLAMGLQAGSVLRGWLPEEGGVAWPGYGWIHSVAMRPDSCSVMGGQSGGW